MTALVARVRRLAVLDFDVPPRLLEARLPAGAELDLFEGRAIVSVLGMLFGRVRPLGVRVAAPIREFAEVNVRFYVRRRAADETRSGVVFLSEIVPRALVAAGARLAFRQPFVVRPTRHAVDERAEPGGTRIAYGWSSAGGRPGFEVRATGPFAIPAPGTEERFVVDRPWGFTRLSGSKTSEFSVGHPLWNVRPASGSTWDAAASDLEDVLPSELAAALASATPRAAFLADGSDMSIGWPRTL